MGLNLACAAATLDGQAQRAALRDGVLACGRQMGWPTRTTIAFTERVARRPWKRCTRAELSAVLREFHSILFAFEVRQLALRPLFLASGRAVTEPARRNYHAPRS